MFEFDPAAMYGFCGETVTWRGGSGRASTAWPRNGANVGGWPRDRIGFADAGGAIESAGATATTRNPRSLIARHITKAIYVLSIRYYGARVPTASPPRRLPPEQRRQSL